MNATAAKAGTEVVERFLDRKRVFEVIGAEGETFFVQARSFSEAFEKFRKWEDPKGTEDLEEPQSIRDAGWLVGPETIQAPIT